jgi:hypothetical protein
MSGEGHIAKLINDQYHKYTHKYGLGHERMNLDCSGFRRPGEQGKLF